MPISNSDEYANTLLGADGEGSRRVCNRTVVANIADVNQWVMTLHSLTYSKYIQNQSHRCTVMAGKNNTFSLLKLDRPRDIRGLIVSLALITASNKLWPMRTYLKDLLEGKY